MNSLANELNSVLKGTVAERLLSRLGRRFYFPKGIIAQSAEAKKSAHRANATIGMAYKNGKPLIISAIADNLPGLKPEETVIYAPTAGVEKVRKVWQDLLIQKNPSLDPEKISLPVVVPGLTGGISYMADLFLDEEHSILLSNPCWDNYDLIFHERRGANLIKIPFLGTGPGIDMALMEQSLKEAAKTGTVRIIFNFPNNPSGYSPSRAEVDILVNLIGEIAANGADVLVLCDDAYFGLFYEEHIHKESLFSPLSSLHNNVLAVKIDGPTKEDYVWGFRMGFLTFGSRGLSAEHHEALVKKLMGAIRSSVSCTNTAAQYLMLKTLEDPRSQAEKEQYADLLQRRYQRVKHFINGNPPHPRLQPLPFNSGYFMTFHCLGISAEKLRQGLLAKHGIGTISFGEHYLRVAFASIDEEQIPGIYQAIYDTATELS